MYALSYSSKYLAFLKAPIAVEFVDVHAEAGGGVVALADVAGRAGSRRRRGRCSRRACGQRLVDAVHVEARSEHADAAPAPLRRGFRRRARRSRARWRWSCRRRSALAAAAAPALAAFLVARRGLLVLVGEHGEARLVGGVVHREVATVRVCMCMGLECMRYVCCEY